MPKTQQLMGELQGEKDYGILLVVQMGGVPNELQLIIQTALYDDSAQGLRERNTYIVRVLGVREHRVTLGLFGRMFFASDHPVLHHHNLPRFEVHFEGRPQDVHELALDIHQAYLVTFGPWREIAADLNRTQPLVNLLASGGGLLGTMPQPAAERMVKVLEYHGLSARLNPLAEHETEDEHGRSRLAKLLGIDDSYFVALDFSVEQMGKV